ncbi:uncharacterized protein LOC108915421 [Anoplophora glabripennis]|uniref:uncharacterized protein LOC108915421 n=1 Tax=Anoplophora glabripennis TaxID=217634 RepID=UPI0008743BF1|nr:uncharacterized protein LOC108915421 [Anoplophora glabripennis]
MEPNFAQANSENLPEVNYIMIQEFFAKNMDYFSVEFRSAKNIRASRACYGDEAIGYVQVKHDTNICTVKGRVVPEHRVHQQAYSVTARFDEENDVIISCQCENCAASQGGCKHAIAFLYWIFRRNNEKSPTSVEIF